MQRCDWTKYSADISRYIKNGFMELSVISLTKEISGFRRMSVPWYEEKCSAATDLDGKRVKLRRQPNGSLLQPEPPTPAPEPTMTNDEAAASRNAFIQLRDAVRSLFISRSLVTRINERFVTTVKRFSFYSASWQIFAAMLSTASSTNWRHTICQQR